jgi:hypothetical protein
MGSDFWGRGRKPRPKQFVASKILRKLQQWHDGKERRNSKRIMDYMRTCCIQLKSIYACVIGPSLFFEPQLKSTTHPNFILVEMGLTLEFLWTLLN